MNKRYTRARAEATLARLARCAFEAKPPTEAGLKDSKSWREVRQVLRDVVQAPAGDVVAAPSMLDRIAAAAPFTLNVWLHGIRDQIVSAAPGARATQMDVLVLPHVQLRGQPNRTGDYVFEVDVSPTSDPIQAGWARAAFDQGILHLQTLRLLRMVGRDRLHRCASVECGKLFVRRGRREFCSDRCQKRVYMRKFRAGEVAGD